MLKLGITHSERDYAPHHPRIASLRSLRGCLSICDEGVLSGAASARGFRKSAKRDGRRGALYLGLWAKSAVASGNRCAAAGGDGTAGGTTGILA
jgi:hypothetical protein